MDTNPIWKVPMKIRISSGFYNDLLQTFTVVNSINYLSSSAYFCQSFEYTVYEKNINRIDFAIRGSVDFGISINTRQA